MKRSREYALANIGVDKENEQPSADGSHIKAPATRKPLGERCASSAAARVIAIADATGTTTYTPSGAVLSKRAADAAAASLGCLPREDLDVKNVTADLARMYLSTEAAAQAAARAANESLTTLSHSSSVTGGAMSASYTHRSKSGNSIILRKTSFSTTQSRSK